MRSISMGKAGAKGYEEPACGLIEVGIGRWTEAGKACVLPQPSR